MIGVIPKKAAKDIRNKAKFNIVPLSGLSKNTKNKVESTDSPLEAAKRGKDTSMWLSIESVKRKESDIPSSIFILDEEMIYKASNQHFEDLIQTIPNINWSGDGNRARYFQIRGVGELEQYEGAPNPSIDRKSVV